MIVKDTGETQQSQFQVHLELPYPPSVNHYWMTRGNYKFISKRGREYRQNVAEIVAAAGYKMDDARLSVFIRVFPPDRRRRDLDNTLKAALDAMSEAGLFNDDEQIDHLELLRGPVLKGGKLAVVVTICPPSWCQALLD